MADEISFEGSQWTREELDRIARNTRDPSVLSKGMLDAMKREKVGPFAGKWIDGEA